MADQDYETIKQYLIEHIAKPDPAEGINALIYENPYFDLLLPLLSGSMLLLWGLWMSNRNRKLRNEIEALDKKRKGLTVAEKTEKAKFCESCTGICPIDYKFCPACGRELKPVTVRITGDANCNVDVHYCGEDT